MVVNQLPLIFGVGLLWVAIGALVEITTGFVGREREWSEEATNTARGIAFLFYTGTSLIVYYVYF